MLFRSSSWYARYAAHAASWGYAVLQYDARPLALTPDALELGWLGDAVAWAAASAPVDASTLVLSGHSRGAKLAALHWAGARAPPAPAGGPTPRPAPRAVACFLLDAVDSTSFAPPSRAYPSAADALPGAGPVGLASAAVVGACNPGGSGYRRLWPATAPGSANLVLAAGHAQFYDGGAVWNRLSDLLCGVGPAGRDATMRIAAASLVAWADDAVRPGAGGGRRALAAWAGAAAAAGRGEGAAVEAWQVKKGRERESPPSPSGGRERVAAAAAVV